MLTSIPDVQKQVHEMLEGGGNVPALHTLQLLFNTPKCNYVMDSISGSMR
jgi:hypothetical protein